MFNRVKGNIVVFVRVCYNNSLLPALLLSNVKLFLCHEIDRKALPVSYSKNLKCCSKSA